MVISNMHNKQHSPVHPRSKLKLRLQVDKQTSTLHSSIYNQAKKKTLEQKNAEFAIYSRFIKFATITSLGDFESRKSYFMGQYS
jgi:hypothetical protein